MVKFSEIKRNDSVFYTDMSNEILNVSVNVPLTSKKRIDLVTGKLVDKHRNCILQEILVLF